MSFGCATRLEAQATMALTRFLCERITPLGGPVDPEVYMIIAASSALGGSAEKQSVYFIYNNNN